MASVHLDAVLDIEIVSHHSPWTRGNFVDSLTAGHPATVVLDDGAVQAYAVCMSLPGEAELLNITVAPDARRNGLGGQLLAYVCSQARCQGAERIFLEVRASNQPARSLYLREGFLEVGRRRDYYAATDADGQPAREDAILMAKELKTA